MLIDRLEFSDSVRNALPGIGTRLSGQALSTTGTAIPMRVAVSWSSSDTLSATVYSAGEVRVKSIRAVTVTAPIFNGPLRCLSETPRLREDALEFESGGGDIAPAVAPPHNWRVKIGVSPPELPPRIATPVATN